MKLNIPKPCHESWQNMTPNSRGRHCDLCVKTVVDFTKMNPNEIKVFFENKTEGKICGRIKEDQLHNSSLRINVSKTLRIVGLASILFLFPFSNALAQESNSIILTSDTLDQPSHFNGELMGDIEIVGLVIDEGEEEEYPKGSLENPYQFSSVENKAQFPGGFDALKTYIINNIGKGPFPSEERIYVSFVIDSTGNCVKPKIERGRHPILKEKVINIVLNFPRWQPARHNGKAVAVSYTLPFTFVHKKD